MNLLLIEIREDALNDYVSFGNLEREDFTIVGQYPMSRSKEAQALLKTRTQAMKDASEAYRTKMKEVETIDEQLQKLNEDDEDN